MSRRDDRRYKIVYKTKTREPEYETPSRHSSSRDTGVDYEVRSPASDARVYSAARPREQHRDYDTRRDSPDTYELEYERDDGVIVVERPRRRSPPRYAHESASRRREPRNDGYEQPSLRTSRTMPTYPSDHGRGPVSVVESRSGRYAMDDSDDDERPRGRRDRQGGNISPPRRLRSCIRGSRDVSPDRPRLRARSVNFREQEASKHDVGNQFHERPGEEARMMGQYLRHDDDDDLASITYAARRGVRDYY